MELGDDAFDDLRREVASLRAQVRARDARFRAVVERGPDGVLVVDSAGVIVFVNEAAARLLGRAQKDLVGYEVGFPVSADEATEVELIAPDREVRYAELRVAETEWDGRPCRLALLRDVSDRHRAEAELVWRATHDHLTGLPTRFLLEDRLAQALARLQRPSRPGALAVFVVDIDEFKAINDRFGHRAGDEVLVETARRIVSALRTIDTAARVGGDEFVLLCEGMTTERCDALALRLQQRFDAPFPVGATEVQVQVSLGYTLTTDAAADPAHVLEAADRAMYTTKQARQGRHPSPRARR
jgi:diguanylate cyclase (GGDEF)-like protein/PAS domain S-box-containing protein